MEIRTVERDELDGPRGADSTRQDVIRDVSTLLNMLIRALVDFPNDVLVRPVAGSQAVIFEVGVHAEDVRRVIGRKGRTADALREILINLGSKSRSRFLLEVIEPVERSRTTYSAPDRR